MIGRQTKMIHTLLGTSRRAFSKQVAVAGTEKPAEIAADGSRVKSLWQYSTEQAAQTPNEDEYLEELKAINTQPGVFKTVAEDSNSEHTRSIQAQINKIVKQEIDLIEFKDAVSQEALAQSAYDEVVTKENFFFKVDEAKRERNLAIHDMTAPGNKHRKPQVILPHEHIHIDHYIDLDGKDKDQLMELYGHYSYLIDLHIAQIRPENLQEKSYVPSKYAQVAPNEHTEKHLNNMYFEYYHRWREPTRTWYSETQEINFKKTLESRPTTAHYDHDKGDKYEIEWKDEQKFPHVASRLGYPILREEPIERIVGLERAPAHPGYQLQAFVQTPSMNPDPTLNFQVGETIYENRHVLEWTRFWKTVTAVTFGFTPGFYVFEMYAADGLPSIDWIADSFSWHKIPKQFQDGSGYGLEGMRYCDDHDYMNFQYGGKRALARPAHTAYMCQLLVLLSYMNMDYVSRMVYNKEKDLVFVYKPEGLWNEKEFVHEMHHLEQMVPYPVSAIKNMALNKDDGIMTVYDMNEHEELKFFNEDKYWNLDLKEEFVGQTNSLFIGNWDDKRRGQIFMHHDAMANQEESLMVSSP